MNAFYTAVWVFWFVWLIGFEVMALIDRRPGDTLSEHIWHWFSIKNKGNWWYVRRAALLIFLVWLLVHMTIQ